MPSPFTHLRACALLFLSLAGAHALAAAPAHVVLVSIDGFRPDFYRDASWPAPNLQGLARSGASADGVVGVLPTLTYPSHTTLITGVRPGVHGIYGNTRFAPELESAEWHIDSSEIQARTLWQAVRAAGLSSAAISWPITRNAPIDFNLPEVWYYDKPDDRTPAIRDFATPAGLLDEIEKQATGRLRGIDVDYRHLAMDENNSRALAYLIRQYRPNLAAIHLVAADTAQHASGREGQASRRAVASVDHALGTLLDAVDQAGLSSSTWFVVVGDHGFTDVHTQLAPNVWLAQAGVDAAGAGWQAAFHAAGGTAFLHLRDPGPATLARVQDALRALPPAIRDAFDIIDGAALQAEAADPRAALALVARPGFLFSNRSTGDAARPGRGGAHGHHPAQPELRTGLLLAGPGVPSGRVLGELRLEDVAPLVARLLHLRDFANRPLPPALDFLP